jgi:4-amino-4-deoxy-L-arabinose transferase-like glycosyltransferase
VSGIELSVIAPTFNERGNIAALLKALQSSLHETDWELIIVDDDSPDGTAAFAKELAQLQPRLRCIRRIGRRGLAGAAIEGFLSSSAPYLALIDADMQHDETLLPKMLSTLKGSGCDIVIGSRYVEGGAAEGLSNKGRVFLSKLGGALARRILRNDVSDPMSGFFMMRRNVFETLAPKLSKQGFKILFDILSSSGQPLRIKELPYNFKERHAGESKLGAAVKFEYLSLLANKALGRILPQSLFQKSVFDLPPWLWLIMLGIMGAQYVLCARLDLSFDEAYYWLWAKHLQLSYFDHPPLTAWLIALSTKLFGNSEAAVRFFAPFLVFCSSLLLAGTAKDFGGDKRAKIFAALLPYATLIGPIAGLIITPDTPLLFTISLTLRLLARYYKTGDVKLLMPIGAAFGLALLSKYTAFAFGAGIFIWLLSSPLQRQVFSRWPAWAGVVLALVIFSPVLIWNTQHSWQSFSKQGGRALQPFVFSFHTVIDFIGAQVLLITPLLMVLAVISGCIYARRAWRGNNLALLLCLISLPLPLYFLVMALGGKVEANWVLVAFPGFTVMIALISSEFWERYKLFIKSAYGFGLILSIALLIYLFSPMQNELGRKDITHRLSGHKQVAQAVAITAAQEKICMIVTADYASAALLGYYLRDRYLVTQINEPERYEGWDLPKLDTCAGQALIAFAPAQNLQAQSFFKNQFAALIPITTINRVHRGRAVEAYNTWRVRL